MQKDGKKLPEEDTINARLRELTAETRRLAAELRGFVRGSTQHSRDKARSLARDLPSMTRRKKVR